MRNAVPRLLGIGDNTVDVYVDKGLMFPGGNTVNVAAMWARLGKPSSYLGCVSYDAYGELIYRALMEEKVDLSHCRRSHGQNACSLVGHDGGDRHFLGSRKGVTRDITLTEDDYIFMSSFEVVHTSIFSGLDRYVPLMANRCRLLSYDLSNRWNDDHLQHLAGHLDVAFLSLSEFDAHEAVQILQKWTAAGSGIAVGTRGGAGSFAVHNGKVYSAGVKPVTVVDTLGAGDGFATGFLLEWCTSSDVDRALEAGASNAAEICTIMGGFGHGIAFDTPPDDLPPRSAVART
ncbi:PfkB family carbohydrate kinase [Devosia sp.]|uniref:PfkB family carbohydrate kinase n=1 Tax=Devosia sp. TaxID=1871048 RepID=UPI0019F305E9|nr:PfkB family carbohydrate kinase [Devosia sp.]MBE0578767.1 sugar kinase [Devosia sp.]